MSSKLANLTLISTLAIPTVSLAAELTQWEEESPDEFRVANKMGEELIKIVTKEYSDKGKRFFRDAHPRGIGCVEATFTVNPNLPAEFRTGVFAKPGQTYDALIRFSSSLAPVGDNVKDARGLAIKLFGVQGEKLLANERSAVTHDFLHIDAPIFPAKNAEEFAGIVSLKSNPANAVPFLAAKPILRARELKAVLDMSSNNPNNGKSLAERTYFSQTAYLLKGEKIKTPIKFATMPCGKVSPGTLDGTEAELRNDLQARLNQDELCFQFGVQRYRDGLGWTVEDGMNEWKASDSPFTTVATIKIPKQKFLTDEKLEYCDNLSFQPWHALPEHRPLGNINRTRKIVYELLSNFRHQSNKAMASRPEPRDLSEWRSLKSDVYSRWKGVMVEP